MREPTAVYTQAVDVEIEVNGYVTYDREVEKMDFARVTKAHAELMAQNSQGEPLPG